MRSGNERQLNSHDWKRKAKKQKKQANPPERSMYSAVCFSREADYKHTWIKGPTLILCLQKVWWMKQFNLTSQKCWDQLWPSTNNQFDVAIRCWKLVRNWNMKCFSDQRIMASKCRQQRAMCKDNAMLVASSCRGLLVVPLRCCVKAESTQGVFKGSRWRGSGPGLIWEEGV